jgi:hypothetical protein
MLSVISINKIDKEPYLEIITSGGKYGVPVKREEVIAPILGFYSIEISVEDMKKTYEAEVRKTPGGEQVDWSEELQGLLMEHKCNEKDFSSLSNAIYSLYSSLEVKLPMTLGSNAL